jgi:hypothetical protein
MNIETSNGGGDHGYERKQGAVKLDQAALKRWLTTEVELTVPRWAIVAAGFVTFLLFAIALD